MKKSKYSTSVYLNKGNGIGGISIEDLRREVRRAEACIKKIQKKNKKIKRGRYKIACSSYDLFGGAVRIWLDIPKAVGGR